jgi:hypothetical protein
MRQRVMRPPASFTFSGHVMQIALRAATVPGRAGVVIARAMPAAPRLIFCASVGG